AITVIAWGFAVYRAGDEQVWLAVHGVWSGRTWSDYLARNPPRALMLLVELMPAILLAPFAVRPWWRDRMPASGPRVVKPLLLYSAVCTGVIVLWPGFASRYAMPIAPAVAVLGGLGWDAIKDTGLVRLRWIAGGLVTLFIAFQLALVTIVIPIHADRF